MAANEARSAGFPAQARPAIGGGGRQPRKVLIWEGAIALLLLVVMLLAKHEISARETGDNPLAALPAGNQVAAGLDVGGVPTDADLTGLAGSYNVDGVVNLTAPNVGEQATCAYLHISYMHLAMTSDAAPTLAQLRTLAAFMRSDTSKGDYVYLHDYGGGGTVVSTASMLLILKGESWQAVRKDLTSGELASLTSGQKQAIAQLAAALAAEGNSLPGNPYAGARIYPW